MHVLLLTKRYNNDPGYTQQLVKAYDLEGEEANSYCSKIIGLRGGEVVTLDKESEDTDAKCTSLKEEAWETLALMEENKDLVDIVSVSVTG